MPDDRKKTSSSGRERITRKSPSGYYYWGQDQTIPREDFKDSEVKRGNIKFYKTLSASEAAKKKLPPKPGG